MITIQFTTNELSDLIDLLRSYSEYVDRVQTYNTNNCEYAPEEILEPVFDQLYDKLRVANMTAFRARNNMDKDTIQS